MTEESKQILEDALSSYEYFIQHSPTDCKVERDYMMSNFWKMMDELVTLLGINLNVGI